MKLRNFSLTALAAFGLLAGGTQAFAQGRSTRGNSNSYSQPYSQGYSQQNYSQFNERDARRDFREDYRESRIERERRERRERREHEEWLKRQRLEHRYDRDRY